MVAGRIPGRPLLNPPFLPGSGSDQQWLLTLLTLKVACCLQSLLVVRSHQCFYTGTRLHWKTLGRGKQRDVSLVKSTGSSSREPGFNSQDPHRSSQPSAARHICKQNTNVHKIIFKKDFGGKQSYSSHFLQHWWQDQRPPRTPVPVSAGVEIPLTSKDMSAATYLGVHAHAYLLRTPRSQGQHFQLKERVTGAKSRYKRPRVPKGKRTAQAEGGWPNIRTLWGSRCMSPGETPVVMLYKSFLVMVP